jgi:hypothetical protein
VEIPAPIHPSLLAILPHMPLVHDCWDLLNGRKEYYLPRGEREQKIVLELSNAASNYNNEFLIKLWN